MRENYNRIHGRKIFSIAMHGFTIDDGDGRDDRDDNCCYYYFVRWHKQQRQWQRLPQRQLRDLLFALDAHTRHKWLSSSIIRQQLALPARHILELVSFSYLLVVVNTPLRREHGPLIQKKKHFTILLFPLNTSWRFG